MPRRGHPAWTQCPRSPAPPKKGTTSAFVRDARHSVMAAHTRPKATASFAAYVPAIHGVSEPSRLWIPDLRGNERTMNNARDQLTPPPFAFSTTAPRARWRRQRCSDPPLRAGRHPPWRSTPFARIHARRAAPSRRTPWSGPSASAPAGRGTRSGTSQSPAVPSPARASARSSIVFSSVFSVSVVACSRMAQAWVSKSSAILRLTLSREFERLPALGEAFLREFPRPCHSKRGRLHRAFAALARELCRISCHSSLLC